MAYVTKPEYVYSHNVLDENHNSLTWEKQTKTSEPQFSHQKSKKNNAYHTGLL